MCSDHTKEFYQKKLLVLLNKQMLQKYEKTFSRQKKAVT